MVAGAFGACVAFWGTAGDSSLFVTGRAFETDLLFAVGSAFLEDAIAIPFDAPFDAPFFGTVLVCALTNLVGVAFAPEEDFDSAFAEIGLLVAGAALALARTGFGLPGATLAFTVAVFAFAGAALTFTEATFAAGEVFFGATFLAEAGLP